MYGTTHLRGTVARNAVDGILRLFVLPSGTRRGSRTPTVEPDPFAGRDAFAFRPVHEALR